MNRQFTATVYILSDEKVLLIFHKKFGKWLPPGGHLEENETPVEAVHREALEETGLEIELIPQENISISRWNATSMTRPYLCLLENVPAFGEEPPHQHIDMIYLAKPKSGTVQHNQSESESIQWFSLEEILDMEGDEDIFEETRQTIQHLLGP